jgi:uncharacterized protein with HEPN domain
MRREQALLWDVCHAADAVAAFTRGKTLEDYQGDQLLRSAVERQLTILGEALVKISSLSPELAERIPDHGAVIAFRNVLIHGYATIVDETVWGILSRDLPVLRARAARLLEELTTPG